MSIPFRVTPSSITMVLNGVTHIVTDESHANYAKIREALKNKEFDLIEELIDLPKAVEAFGAGKVEVVNGVIMFSGRAIHNTLTRRMLEQMAEGFDIGPMALFLENLMENPSKRAVDELYDFMEACDLPITDDGHLVAYKKVSNEYLDLHTRTIDNSIGQVVEMPRNMVDEDKARTCSAGLHFCSQSYLPHFGGSGDDRVLILKINPRDIVAIPADYQNAKGRTCRYEVVGEVDPKQLKFYEKSVYQVTQPGGEEEVDDWDEIVGDDVTSTPVNTMVAPSIDPSEPMTVRAAHYGFLKNGLVPVTYGDEIMVHNHDNIPDGAVMRSYETKSVRAAVKAAVEAIEANADSENPDLDCGVSVDFSFGYEYNYEIDLNSLDDAKDYIRTAFSDEELFSARVLDQDGAVIHEEFNENYVNDDSSSSSSEEMYEDSSSSEDLDSEDDTQDEPTPDSSPAVFNPKASWPFPVDSKEKGTLFTKTQAAAIMGVNQSQLGVMIENGDRVELMGNDMIRFKS